MDWKKLQRLLGHVSEQVSLERLQSITMVDLARKVREKERAFVELVWNYAGDSLYKDILYRALKPSSIPNSLICLRKKR